MEEKTKKRGLLSIHGGVAANICYFARKTTKKDFVNPAERNDVYGFTSDSEVGGAVFFGWYRLVLS
jgi:hypothetical protein